MGRAQPPFPYHLLAPREPRLDTCTHGRPDHQAMIRQLGKAMGLDLGAINATPEQVWAGLLDEVERRFRLTNGVDDA
jgi:hypothetical protein